jgi:hypothetical protein
VPKSKPNLRPSFRLLRNGGQLCWEFGDHESLCGVGHRGWKPARIDTLLPDLKVDRSKVQRVCLKHETGGTLICLRTNALQWEFFG